MRRKNLTERLEFDDGLLGLALFSSSALLATLALEILLGDVGPGLLPPFECQLRLWSELRLLDGLGCPDIAVSTMNALGLRVEAGAGGTGSAGSA